MHIDIDVFDIEIIDNVLGTRGLPRINVSDLRSMIKDVFHKLKGFAS